MRNTRLTETDLERRPLASSRGRKVKVAKVVINLADWCIAGGSECRYEYELSQLRQGRVPNGADKGRGSGLAQELLPVRAVQQAAQCGQL